MPVATAKALKEWAVVVRAMDLGLQTILLRKGGIVEEKRRFALEAGEFFLMPTYTHQGDGVLQPQYRSILDDPFCVPRHDGTVVLSHWAKVVDLLALRTPEQVRRLAEFYIWTPDYVFQRFQWKPKYPLNLLVLRVYRLAQPRVLPSRPEYGGCRSWADIELDPAELWRAESCPVMSDREFESRVSRMIELLAV